MALTIDLHSFHSLLFDIGGILALTVYLHAGSRSYIIGQFLDAPWESSGVCLQASLGVPLMRGPAVIDADVFVASLFPSLLHHHICHLHVEALAAGATGGRQAGRIVSPRCQEWQIQIIPEVLSID